MKNLTVSFNFGNRPTTSITSNMTVNDCWLVQNQRLKIFLDLQENEYNFYELEIIYDIENNYISMWAKCPSHMNMGYRLENFEYNYSEDEMIEFINHHIEDRNKAFLKGIGTYYKVTPPINCIKQHKW